MPGYLYYYDGEDEQPTARYVPPRVIWRGCLRQCIIWTAVFGLMALYIWVAGIVGYM